MKDGKITAPVKLPGHRVSLYGYSKLVEDWEALSEQEEEDINPWDALL